MKGDLGNQDVFEQVVREWVPALKLCDWMIEVKYGGHASDGSRVRAETFSDSAEKRAEIRFYEDWDREDEEHWLVPQDVLVVHELCHLVFAEHKLMKFKNPTASNEWIVGRASVLLVAAKKLGEKLGRGVAHRDVGGII